MCQKLRMFQTEPIFSVGVFERYMGRWKMYGVILVADSLQDGRSIYY